MKKFILTTVLATGFAASAFATLPDSDLVLGFRDLGNAGGTNTTQNLQIDLGNISLFKNSSIYAAGVTTSTGIDLTNLGTIASPLSISTLFGGTTWTENSGLKWGIAGTERVPNNNVIWGGKATNSSLLNGIASTTASVVQTTSQQAMGSSKIAGIYQDQPSQVYVSTPTTGDNSWKTVEAYTTNAFGFTGFGATATVFENSTLMGVNSHNYVAADLYEFVPVDVPGTKPKSVYLGTFSIANTGIVSYTAAIPEPSTYAAILGAATLGFVMMRRRKQLVA